MLRYTASGNIGRDAEKRDAKGNSVVSFSIGVSTGYGDNKTTLWLDASIWGQRGEKLLPYLKKGTKVFFTGEGGVRTYEKDGKTNTILTVRIDDLDFGGGRDNADQGQQESRGNGGNRNQQNYAGARSGSNFGGGRGGPQDDLEDSIPF